MAKAKKDSGIGRYKLLPDAGPHFQRNPDFDETIEESDDNVRDIEYVAGDIVESDRPLDKVFVNKFQKVGGDEVPTRRAPGGQVSRNAEDDPNKDRPVRSTEDATRATADRFLEDDELEGKPEELRALARGEGAKKKSVLDDDEEEDEDASDEVVDEEEDEDVSDSPRKRPSRSNRATKIRKANK